MTPDQVRYWLFEEDDRRLAQLWREADRVRRESVGEEVHLRGLIEFSNVCVRNCTYCGLRSANRSLPRYRMIEEEIIGCAADSYGRGYGTVVLQSGDDYGAPTDLPGNVIPEIKRRFPLVVTLSVGERSLKEYRFWRQAGADRLLLKFETSDRRLFRRIHPPHTTGTPDRLQLLGALRDLGYEIGSGIMVGIPGQTYESLARDIALFAEMDLDMIAVGPYVPHPDTPMGRGHPVERPNSRRRVPNTERMTRKVLALTRLACPEANMPATTALATMGWDGFSGALEAGANVIMPNVTPWRYRRYYSIYPSPAHHQEFDAGRMACRAIGSAGRVPGRGRGDRLRRSPEAWKGAHGAVELRFE